MFSLLGHVKEGHGPCRGDVRLERGQVGWIGVRVERCHRDPTVGASLSSDADERVDRQTGVQHPERFSHFGLKIGDVPLRIERQIQRLIISRSPRTEVGRKVVVRVAIPIGADDPDLLAAHFLAKRLQDAYLVSDPIDARPAVVVFSMTASRQSPRTMSSTGTILSAGKA
jgi:hypothetical protein